MGTQRAIEYEEAKAREAQGGFMDEESIAVSRRHANQSR